MRNVGVIVVLILWAWLGLKMCNDYAACCSDDAVGTENNAAVPIISKVATCKDGLVCFADNSCEATYSESFEQFRDSLMALVSEGKQLRITGIYDSKEKYEGEADNLGYCRAEALGSKFTSLSNNQISTAGQLTMGRKVGIADRYSFEVIDISADQSSNVSSATLIYFPYNSTNKLADNEIEIYLNEVATTIKDNGGKVKLVGHTDDKGRAVKNIELGQRRANVIADYLMGQGLLRSQIMSESKGESEPVADNASEVGRAKNRRVELQIIK